MSDDAVPAPVRFLDEFEAMTAEREWLLAEIAGGEDQLLTLSDRVVAVVASSPDPVTGQTAIAALCLAILGESRALALPDAYGGRVMRALATFSSDDDDDDGDEARAVADDDAAGDGRRPDRCRPPI